MVSAIENPSPSSATRQIIIKHGAPFGGGKPENCAKEPGTTIPDRIGTGGDQSAKISIQTELAAGLTGLSGGSAEAYLQHQRGGEPPGGDRADEAGA